MSEVTVKIRPPYILFNCPPNQGHLADRVSSTCKYDKTYKAFKAPFGIEQLVRLKKEYPTAVIVEGQEYIDRLKIVAKNVEMGKIAFIPLDLDPNCPKFTRQHDFKLTPFNHQLVGLHFLDLFEGAPVFGDCGTGKTATTLWDIEIKIKEGKLKRSKVLIVAKLMTLFSGWHEDTEKFTNLNSLVLWQPPKSKTNYDKEAKIVLADHGPKPPGKAKHYEKIEIRFRDDPNEVAILKSAKMFREHKHIKMARKWKQVGDVKYGEETLTPVTTTNVRSENIRALIQSDEHDIHIINHEGLVLFADELAERGYDYIAVDESTVIKNSKSKTFEAALRVGYHSKYRRILTGTPSPLGPHDLWAQFYFLDFGVTLGPDYREFLAKHFNVIKLGSHERGTYSGEKILVRKDGEKGLQGTLEWVETRLQNRIFRCRLRDCIDLPEKFERVLDVYLEGDLRKHYEQMEEELRVELQDKEVEVTTDLAKILKLRQITSGFIINKEKSVISLAEKNPKLEVLKTFLEEIPDEKAVIFATYREEIRMLLELFGKKAVAIYGGASATDKLSAGKLFINDPNIQYVICQPQSAAYGVNGLTVARYLIFYSMENRADLRYQAIKRIERTGQTRNQYIISLMARDTIDEVIYRSNDKKDALQQKTIDFDIINRFKRR